MSVSKGYRRVVLAVARMNLDVGTREFVRKTDEITQHLSNRVSALLLSPPVFPLYETLIGKRRYGNYRSNLKTLVSRLSSISRRRGITLVLTPVLRRAGNKLYLSNVLIPSVGPPLFRGKSVIPVSSKVSGSPNVEMITIENVNICFAILNDLEVPEVTRAYAFLGGDAIVAVSPPIITRRRPEMTLMFAATRANENDIPIIGIGGYAENGSIQQPTFIIERDGHVAEVARDAEPDIFEVEVPSIGRRPQPEIARKYLKFVRDYIVRNYEVLKKYLIF